MDWSFYNTISNIDGATKRERSLNRLQRNISKNNPNNLAYKTDVEILNKRKINCILENYRKEGDTPPKMDIKTTLDNEFELGDVFILIEEDGTISYWICTDKNNYHNAYFKGLLRECNQLFKFQNGTPKILEYWGFTENPYSTTLSNGNVVSVPTNKLNFTMPYNDDTMKIFIDKRFVTEIGYDKNGKEIPIVYKVTSRESNTTNFSGGRFLKMMAEFDAHTDKDSVEFMIADYIPDDGSVDPPTPPDPDLLKCEISGSSSQIKVGGSVRQWAAKFYEVDGVTEAVGVVPIWEYELDDEYVDYIGSLKCTQNGNFISIQCDDENLIGATLKLSLVDSNGLYNKIYLNIDIVPFMRSAGG